MAADEGVLDPLEDWQLVGEAYYSRRQLYELDWGAAASGGGGDGMNLAFMRCAVGLGKADCSALDKIWLH